ncbi:hypothetical protein ACQKIP_36500, partial [Streptomyces sp. NPDC059900]
MRIAGAVRAVAAFAACGVLLTSCGSADDGADAGGKKGGGTDQAKGAEPTTDLKRIPEVGDRLQDKIPANSRQVVAVYGEGEDSADSTVVLYTKSGSTWDKTRSWAAHNGKKGWTTDHRENDKRSPVGVYTLTDAGG